MWISYLRIAPVLALAMAVAPACDSPMACTLIGCAVDGVTVSLVGPGGAAPTAGTYLVTAVAGDTTQRCELAFPDDGAATSCRLYTPPGSDPRGVSWFGFAPDTVTITVTRDGTTVGELKDFEPDYATSRPNGGDCGPVCRLGPAVVEVTP